MIYEIAGSINFSKAWVIAYGAVVGDSMGQGLTKSLRKCFLILRKDFHYWCHQQHRMSRKAGRWGVINGNHIINSLT